MRSQRGTARLARAVGVAAGILMIVSACLANPSPMFEDGDRDQPPGLPDYRQEVGILTDVPGASASAAAGLLNPAAWSIQGRPGLFLAWSDSVGGRSQTDDRPAEWSTVLSLRSLGFGWRRFNFRDAGGDEAHLDEYTLGLAGGDRSHSTGIAYSWNRGDAVTMPRHQRLTVGEIYRWRQASVGGSAAFDLEHKDNYGQIDLGLRPFGPRLTFFADAVTNYGDRFKDITLGGGLELHPLPGIVLAAKADDLGEITLYSCRIGLALGDGGGRPEFRMRFNEDGDHVATDYCLDLGVPSPRLGAGIFTKGRSYPELTLKGSMAYQRFRFFDDRRTLMSTLQEINARAEDPRVGGVVVDLSGMTINAAMLWELREQLAGLRAAGKTVTVYLDRVGLGGYMLASVADQIWIDPEGEIEMPGIAAGRTYMRGAFDKLGLGIAELRFFKYKSALESFSRSSMSDADREQFQPMIDGVYETIAQAATTARGISRSDWDRLIDEKGVLTAKEALAAGLVDSIGTREQAKKAARQVTPRVTRDVSSLRLAGVTGNPVWSPLDWGEPDRIAVLYAIGECAMDSGIKGPLLAKQIKAARENRSVKAVVLRADSPGGDPLPSDLVSRELRETAKVKPVIVSQGQVAGSGGYWISMYGDSILATPFTITGSIGVIGGYIWNNGIGDKIGFTYDFVKRGEHADLDRGILLPFINQTIPERPMTDDERARAEETIRALYDDFVDKVAEGRGLTKEEVDAVGQGRVWIGTDGKTKGLVDEIGGLWASLRMAKDAARLPATRGVTYTEGPRPGAFDFGALRPRLIGLWQRLAGSGGEAVQEPAGDDGLDGPWSIALETSLLRRLLGDERVAQLPAAERFYLEQLIRSGGRPIMVTEPVRITSGREAL
jgi:protease-4